MQGFLKSSGARVALFAGVGMAGFSLLNWKSCPKLCDQKKKSDSLRIALFAPPGGGKGTLCKKITQEFGCVQISSGDILRNEVRNKTESGLIAKDYMNKGALVPSEIIHSMVGGVLKGEECTKKGFILDGVCRQKENTDFIVSSGLTPHVSIILDVTEEEVQRRLGGRLVDPDTGDSYHKIFNPPSKEILDRCIVRKDDKPDVIAKRFKTFTKLVDETTEPLPKKSLIMINGEGSPKEVWERVRNVLLGASATLATEKVM